jgi:hypothetical protein
MGWVEPYDVTAKAVLRYIRAAKLGDYQAALQLAKIFVSALRGKAPLYPPLADFYAEAFQAIGKGEDPAHALCLNKPPHRVQSIENRQRDARLAWQVFDLVWQDGYTWENAIHTVAEREGESAEVVRHAWRAFDRDANLLFSAIQSARD